MFGKKIKPLNVLLTKFMPFNKPDALTNTANCQRSQWTHFKSRKSGGLYPQSPDTMVMNWESHKCVQGCVHTCAYVCVWVCSHVRVHVWVWGECVYVESECKRRHMSVCMCVRVCVFVCVCVCPMREWVCTCLGWWHKETMAQGKEEKDGIR